MTDEGYINYHIGFDTISKISSTVRVWVFGSERVLAVGGNGLTGQSVYAEKSDLISLLISF